MNGDKGRGRLPRGTCWAAHSVDPAAPSDQVEARGLRRASNRNRAIVVGGAGFIGSHLVDRLVEEGASVLVIDDLSAGSADQVTARATLEVRDIATAPLEDLFRSWRPEVVYHLAAQASVPESARDPLRDLAVNVIGTHRVAEAAALAGAHRLVLASSGGAIYGDTKQTATERSWPAPASYYGVHKLAAEGHVALAGVSYAIARPANVYGPRQRAGLEGAVVASFVDQALHGGPLRIHGDGSQTRDLIHVSDVVGAFRALARSGRRNGIWNVATHHSVTVTELAALVEQTMNRPLGRSFGPRRPGDVMRSSMSARGLHSLGWARAVSLADGIHALVTATIGTDADKPRPRPMGRML